MTPTPTTSELDKFASAIPQRILADVSAHPWLSLLAQGKIIEALPGIERELAFEDAPALVRLCWVNSQFSLNQLPTTALCAPLEELFTRVLDDPALQDYACRTYLRAGLRLLEKKQFRLGMSTLERAQQLDHCMPEEMRISFYWFLHQACLEEIKRAEAKREPLDYINGLQKKRTDLQHLLAEAQRPSSSRETQDEKIAPPTDAKAILTSAFTTNAVGEPALSQRRFRGRFALGVVMTLILSGTSLAAYYLGKTPSNEQLAMGLHLSPGLELTLPPIGENISNLDQNLLSVGQRLQELTLRSIKEVKEKNGAISDEGGDPTAQHSDKIDHQALDPKHARGLAAAKSPEDDELVSLSNVPQAENAIKERALPVYDTTSLGSKSVEDLGSSPKKAPIPEAALNGQNRLQVANDGRIYGTPKEGPPVQAGSRTLEGEPVRAFRVEQYNPPLRYRTITPTRVASAPSILSSTLSELKAETPVNVTARVGPWLELRSVGGKVGYIYAQDAVPADQPTDHW